jgi:hypothetical protein
MDADSVSKIVQDKGPSMTTTSGKGRYLFTVKIVLGENLLGINETTDVDPFLTLSDESGNRIAKTRTLYNTPYPRWNQTFDISVEGSMWLAATVYDRNIVDEHDLLGRAFLRLDPGEYGDFLAHDLWLDLDRHGRVLVRVSMEGEKDDIQFYFGRAFRSLKRAENDMSVAIVDKVSDVLFNPSNGSES